jgi:uncharacterized protein with HEPN domain
MDIVEAADAISSFLAGLSEAESVGDDLLRSAVLQKLTLIGEAAARLTGDFKARHPEVEWSEIIGFRNIAVHRYFHIQWEIVWVAATEDTPELRGQVAQILEGRIG